MPCRRNSSAWTIQPDRRQQSAGRGRRKRRRSFDRSSWADRWIVRASVDRMDYVTLAAGLPLAAARPWPGSHGSPAQPVPCRRSPLRLMVDFTHFDVAYEGGRGGGLVGEALAESATASTAANSALPRRAASTELQQFSIAQKSSWASKPGRSAGAWCRAGWRRSLNASVVGPNLHRSRAFTAPGSDYTDIWFPHDCAAEDPTRRLPRASIAGNQPQPGSGGVATSIRVATMLVYTAARRCDALPLPNSIGRMQCRAIAAGRLLYRAQPSLERFVSPPVAVRTSRWWYQLCDAGAKAGGAQWLRGAMFDARRGICANPTQSSARDTAAVVIARFTITVVVDGLRDRPPDVETCDGLLAIWNFVGQFWRQRGDRAAVAVNADFSQPQAKAAFAVGWAPAIKCCAAIRN